MRPLPGTGPRPHLPLQLPGLDERPAPQLQHPVGADAVEGSASRRGASAGLHPASPPAQERGAGYSAAVATAGIATHSPRSAWRLQGQRVAGLEARGGCRGAEGGPVERDDFGAGGAARA